jgi:hypothetical protein
MAAVAATIDIATDPRPEVVIPRFVNVSIASPSCGPAPLAATLREARRANHLVLDVPNKAPTPAEP